MPTAAFYWRHLRTPLLLFALIAPLLASTSIDPTVAHALFFDEAHSQWVGGSSWWTNELIHRDGSWLIRSLVAFATVVWASTWLRPRPHGCGNGAEGRDPRAPRLRELRRPALYFIVSVALSVGLVGLLKSLTNVDCPRDLTEFGGAFPFIHLFQHRPEALRHARCFPAAHASAGYALLALYFVLRERSRRAARIGLASGLVLGLIFGLAQQSRGAHFVSHDVWSAMLVWTVSLSLYTFVFKARLWNRPQWECNEASAAAPRLPVDGDADLPHRAGAVPGT